MDLTQCAVYSHGLIKLLFVSIFGDALPCIYMSFLCCSVPDIATGASYRNLCLAGGWEW